MPQRYAPSSMTSALGLQAYDYRHAHSDDDSSSDSDRSGSDGDYSRSTSRSSVATGDAHLSILNSTEGEDDNSSDDETKFNSDNEDEEQDLRKSSRSSRSNFDYSSSGYGSRSGTDSRGSSLRNSIETCGMDTVMTGDHVNALLKVYQMPDVDINMEGIASRWNDSANLSANLERQASLEEDRGLVDAYKDAYAKILAGETVEYDGKDRLLDKSGAFNRAGPSATNNKDGSCNNELDQSEKSGTQLDKSGHSTSSEGTSPSLTDRRQRPKLRIRQSQRQLSELNNSLETNKEYDADLLEELQGEFDAADDAAGNKKPNESMGKDAQQSSASSSMDEHFIEVEQHPLLALRDASLKSTRSVALSLRSSFSGKSDNSASDLTSPIDNRTLEKLLFMDDDNSEEVFDESYNSINGTTNTNQGVVENDRKGGVRYQNVQRALRGSLTGLKDLKDHIGGWANHHQDGAFIVESAPMKDNDGKRLPPNIRGTADGYSDMWTVRRKADNESMTSNTNRRGSNQSEEHRHLTASSYEDSSISASNAQQQQQQQGEEWQPQQVHPNQAKGVQYIDEENQYRESWLSTSVILEGVQKSNVNSNKQQQQQQRYKRASVTPYIDEDGNTHHEFQSDGGQYYRPSGRSLKRCLCGLFMLMVMGASAALIYFYAVPFFTLDESTHETYVPIGPHDNDGTTLDEAIETIASHGQYTSDQLYNLAQSVDDHCHLKQLKSAVGRWECQQICHAHFCCFDERHDEYSCQNDENKLCRIFAGCEVLVLDEFVETATAGNNAGEEQVSGKSSGSTNQVSSYGGTVHPEPGVNSDRLVNNNDNSISISNNNDPVGEDLGWQDIRKRYIDIYCEKSNILTKAGRKQCSKLCENHFCCFDTSKDGYNCQDDKSMTCHVYEGCGNMMAEGLFSDEDGPPPSDDVATPDGVAEIPVLPGVGVSLYGDLPFDPAIPHKLPTVVEGESNTMPPEDMQYTNQELHQMKADIKQHCSDYRNPTGHSHCVKSCKSHMCCVSDGEDSCKEDPHKLCDIYASCKVLKVTGTLWQEDKKEETPAKAELISIKEEQEYVDDDQDYVDHDATAAWAEKEKAEKAKAEEDEAKAHATNVDEDLFGEPDDYSFDGIDDIIEEYVIDANEELFGEPDVYSFGELDGTLESTPKPTPKPQIIETAQTSTSISKPPPPPPIRCIPDGDDDFHTELYTDDWNDDRFDRCKRWENKHGMTVAEYWDMQGIDSKVEKNMLIMDTAKAEASYDVDEDLFPNSDIDLDNEPEEMSLDELDDTILEDELDYIDEHDDMYKLHIIAEDGQRI